MKLSTSIVIPNFNGIKLLRKHLRSIVDHSQGSPIIIVDDFSSDQSVEWVKERFPSIQVIQNLANLGFAQSVNIGFQAAKSDLVLLLNNDVSINKNTINRLKTHFQDDKVFAVGCLEKIPKGKRRGRSWGKFHRGLLIHGQVSPLSAGPTLWVFAASGMFSKKIWGQLGGLDPIYRPAYWEDIDISYRAWKSGYKCFFEPRARVEHDAESSMKKVLGIKKNIYAYKNQILFFWKNVNAPTLWLTHLTWFPFHLTLTTLKSRGHFFFGFILALTQLPQALAQRSKIPNSLTDAQVISQSSEHSEPVHES